MLAHGVEQTGDCPADASSVSWNETELKQERTEVEGEERF